MNRVEPTWRAINLETGEDPLGIERSGAFDIALGSRLKKVRGEVRARSFDSKGTISFHDDRITLDTSAKRLLRKDTKTVLELNRTGIYNVECNGMLVCFDAANQEGGLEAVVLRAHTRREATAIAALLPQQMTPTYAADNEQRVLFLKTIATLTPHIWVTWTIIALNTLVFIVMVKGGAGLIIPNAGVTITYGTNFGPLTLSGQWWRLFTSTFIHFGLAHVFFNMLVLAQTGRIVERMFGNVRFMALYVFAGLTGSLMSLLLHPASNSAGASGAIFGVLGALLAYVLRYSDAIPKSIYKKHFRMAALFIVYNLIYGFTHHGVDNGAHVGGLFGGMLIGWMLARPVQYDSTHEAPAMSAGLAGAVAVVALSLLSWTVIEVNATPGRRAQIQFAVVLQQMGPVEKQAQGDLKELPLNPKTAQDRATLPSHIRSDVLPEWNRLYNTIENTPVSSNSAQMQARVALLHYYDDIRRALQITADAADQDKMQDPVSGAAVKRLTEDAKRQFAALRSNPAHP